MGRSRLRRRIAVAAAVTAGVMGVALAVASHSSPPAPVVWRDRVLETNISTAP